MLKKLLNASEATVNERLQAVCRQYSAAVNLKVRVADVLAIQHSGISDVEYGYALMAHFDFVVSDSEHNPLFAVEFDGPSHSDPEQRRRDALKDGLCARFRLPILRCRTGHVSRKLDGWDLVSWLVDVWFMQDAAEKMQEKGELPFDFDLDPAFIIESSDRRRRFPYWLGLDAQLALERWSKAGRIPSHTPRVLYVGIDEKGIWRGFGAFEVVNGLYVTSSIAMRSQAFPVSLADPVRGVVFDDIRSQVDLFLAGSAEGKSVEEVDREWLAIRSETRLLSCFTSADVPQRP